VATYYDIFGQKVQYISSDPANLTEGQVWYNSTSNTAKVQAYSASGVWSTGGALPGGIYGNSGAGTTTAGLSIGGGTGPVPSYISTVNQYDGSSWTSAPSLPFSYSLGGAAGSQTTAIAGGGDGNPPGAMATYDGSSWTATTAIGTNIYQMKFAGSSANAFGTNAYPTSSSYKWNGSAWTTSPAAPSHNYNQSAVGDYDDASFLGGSLNPGGAARNDHMNWNGSSWTTNTVMPISGVTGGQSSNTAPTSNFWIAGFPTSPAANRTLIWNGTSWVTGANMSSTRHNGAGAGSSVQQGFVAGGNAGSTTSNTEEFVSGVLTQTITTS